MNVLRPGLRSLVVLWLVPVCVACGDDSDDGEDSDAGALEDGGAESRRDASTMDASLGDGATLEDGATGEDGGRDGRDDGGRDGGNSEDSGFTRAGSRLLPHGYVVGDLFQLTAIYDSELEHECSYLRTSERNAAEQTFHCVPSDFAELLYTDEDCTEEVVRLSARGACQPDEPPAIVRVPRRTPCGAIRVAAQRIDNEAPLALDAVWRRPCGSDDCEAETTADARFFAPLSGALDDLVAATVEAVPTAEAGLEVEVYVGEDGSRVRGELRWSDGELCSPLATAPDRQSMPCLPAAVLMPSDNIYADEACTEPMFIGTSDPGCDDDPAWSWGVTYEEIDGCFFAGGLFELSAETTEAYTIGDACGPFESAPENWHMHAAVSERSVSDLPTTTTARVGSERLQLEHVAAQDGTLLFPASEWWDSELEQGCAPRLFADGTTRCAPAASVSSDSLFADSECSIPAHAFFVGGCNPDADAQRVRYETELRDDLCTTVVTKVIALQRHTGPAYIDLDGCAETTLDPGQAFFVDGDELDVKDFPALQHTTP